MSLVHWRASFASVLALLLGLMVLAIDADAGCWWLPWSVCAGIGSGEPVMRHTNHLIAEHVSRTPAAASVRAGIHANGCEGLGGRYQRECRGWGGHWRRGGTACFVRCVSGRRMS